MLLEVIKNYLKQPCDFCIVVQEEQNPMTFEIIYHTTILGHVGYIPIVGDCIFGYTVWEVDYEHRYAYVDK